MKIHPRLASGIFGIIYSIAVVIIGTKTNINPEKNIMFYIIPIVGVVIIYRFCKNEDEEEI